MTPDLLSRVSKINASYQPISASCAETQVQQSQEAASPVVGQHRLSHAEREQTIELAELLELRLELQGKTAEAAYAANLKNLLIAGRSQA